MKKNKWLWILSALDLLNTLLIFSNSLKGSVSSTADSDSVISLLNPLIEWIFGKDHQLNLHFLVRKAAHLIEFGALGFLVTLLLFAWKQRKKRYFRGYEFFYVLAVAVVDEFIQSFTGRTSSVKDVLLDFFGALLGFGAAWLITKILTNKKVNDKDGH